VNEVKISDGDSRLVNLVGAVAIGLTDSSVGDVATSAALDCSAAAALVALLDLAKSASVQKLSQLVGLSHSGTVRLVNRLAESDLVERRHGADNRSVSVRLSRRGNVVAKRIRAGRREAIVASLHGLTQQQRLQLATICEVMIANLTAGRLDQRGGGHQPSGGALCRMCDPRACGRGDGQCPAAQTATGP
jgi:MarR family transcriptional regulator, negative regulator of the multidrug operon emrRAB